MMPSLDQIFSAQYDLEKNFESEVKSLQRYASKPDAKQDYIDARNQQLAIIANAIEIIKTYIEFSQLLYLQSIRLRYSISYDSELRQAIIVVTLREGDPMGKTVIIE